MGYSTWLCNFIYGASFVRILPRSCQARDCFDHSKAAGVLLPLQFLPVMRRRYIYLHKVSGRALFVLLLVGNISKCNSPPPTRSEALEY